MDNLKVTRFDPFGLTENPLVALLLLFLAGLTLAFTPCILPMLPIVANIVAKQHNPSVKGSLLLSSAYGLGVAVAYGLLGALLAYAGDSLGLLGFLQLPIVLIIFALIFSLLGLYMLELINIRLPAFIRHKLHSASQKADHKLSSISGSFIAGLLSTLVVSPCVSAPLSGALVAVASIGNIMLGFFALFMLGVGLSVPLVIFSTTEGKFLPKAGEWMNWVKYGFAYLMFAVALMLLDRVFVSPVMLVAWAVWFIVIAVWAWRFSKRVSAKLGIIITKIISLLAIGWAMCLMIGAVTGSTDSTAPLKNIVTDQNLSSQQQPQKPYVTVTTLQELDALLSKENKVLIDVMADWCTQCHIIDKELFQAPPNQMSSWQVVKFDITDTTEQSKAMLKRYQLVGPPALLYYRDGQLLTTQVGSVKRQDFEQLLTVLNDD